MIAVGTLLSNRYLVQDELGMGGMCVVYRAHDLRTDAIVAVKLPHDFLLRDTQFLQRFRREAQIAARIESARVARVTDVNEQDGTPYLVMEYVEGATLADHLARHGALPPQQALAIAFEVARALEAAHAYGVVHRDLKPDNILITRQGDLKVLDFGIARIAGLPGVTTPSIFLGTPEYTAPERAEGLGDIRSDIYAVGVVLYELLTARLPYAGLTPWTIMQQHQAAPLPPLPASVPSPVTDIVTRCLAKRPEDRFQTPRELADAIQSARQALDAEPPTSDHGILRPSDGRDTPDPTPVPDRTLAATVDLPRGPRAGSAPPGPPAPPPASVASRRAAPRRRPVRWLLGAGIAGAVVVVLAAMLLLARRDAAGPGPVRGGTGPPQLVGTTGPRLIVLQPAEGAQVTGPATVQLDVTGVNLKAPAEGDPRGQHIHYFLDVDPATVLAVGLPIPTGQANIIHTAISAHTFPDVTPGPHTIWAVLTGNDHVPLQPLVWSKVSFTSVADPLRNARTGEEAPIVYQALIESKWRIVVKDGLSGAERRLTGAQANDFNPTFSPDGSRIAFNSDRNGTHHIYSMNLDGSDLRQLTQGTTNDNSPAYAPNGDTIVFHSDRDGREHLWTVAVGGGEPQQLTRGPGRDTAANWSRDGTHIVYQSVESDDSSHIFVVEARGGTPRRLTSGSVRDITPAWSPDGKSIAFARYDSNRWNIYVIDADGANARRLTDGTFDIRPAWSPDGKQLLFQSDRDGGQQQIFALPLAGGAARRLTEGPTIHQSASWPMK